jgi:hypothetical protein
VGVFGSADGKLGELLREELGRVPELPPEG